MYRVCRDVSLHCRKTCVSQLFDCLLVESFVAATDWQDVWSRLDRMFGKLSNDRSAVASSLEESSLRLLHVSSEASGQALSIVAIHYVPCLPCTSEPSFQAQNGKRGCEARDR